MLEVTLVAIGTEAVFLESQADWRLLLGHRLVVLGVELRRLEFRRLFSRLRLLLEVLLLLTLSLFWAITFFVFGCFILGILLGLLQGILDVVR